MVKFLLGRQLKSLYAFWDKQCSPINAQDHKLFGTRSHLDGYPTNRELASLFVDSCEHGMHLGFKLLVATRVQRLFEMFLGEVFVPNLEVSSLLSESS